MYVEGGIFNICEIDLFCCLGKKMETDFCSKGNEFDWVLVLVLVLILVLVLVAKVRYFPVRTRVLVFYFDLLD